MCKEKNDKHSLHHHHWETTNNMELNEHTAIHMIRWDARGVAAACLAAHCALPKVLGSVLRQSDLSLCPGCRVARGMMMMMMMIMMMMTMMMMTTMMMIVIIVIVDHCDYLWLLIIVTTIIFDYSYRQQYDGDGWWEGVFASHTICRTYTETDSSSGLVCCFLSPSSCRFPRGAGKLGKTAPTKMS